MKMFAALILALASALYAQTCSTTEPCVQVTISNGNALPSSTVFWTCMGSASSCSSAALQAVIAAQTPTNLCPSVQTVWHCTSFSQTTTPELYNDLEPWGSLMNYAVQGVGAEGVSAASPILIFQVPQPQALQVPALGTATIVTTGTEGPQ